MFFCDLKGVATSIPPLQDLQILDDLVTQGVALGVRIRPFQGEESNHWGTSANLRGAAYFRASNTKCPISGTMSFSIASRTAATEPGIVRTITLLRTPPTARLSIAAGPMSA